MKILIIRVSAIGDVIHTLPSIFLIKKVFPKSQISWVVQKKASSLLLNQLFIDNLWILPDKYLRPTNLAKTFKIIKEIKKTNWNVIIDFQGILKTSLLLPFLNGFKIGFDKNHARAAITTMFTHKQVVPKYKNIIQKNLALVSAVLLRLENKNYTSSPSVENLKQNFYLNFDQEQKIKVENWLEKNKIEKFIILSPNTTWPSKFWPTDNWKKLLEKLDGNLNILLLGKDFGTQALELSQFIETKKLNIKLVPKWNLLTTAYLIKKANLVIAPDTGILHLADFLDTSSIGIFGPTNAKKHGPFLKTENIKNLIQIDCPHFYQKYHGTKEENSSKTTNCMYKLTPEILFEKILTRY